MLKKNYFLTFFGRDKLAVLTLTLAGAGRHSRDQGIREGSEREREG
jgi:hypothetical protein